MSSTKNIIRVTFSASVDGGEGYLTHTARDNLDLINDEGWLWAKDVLGDWKGELERCEDYANASFAGWFDKESPNSAPATSVYEMAVKIWEAGSWPDSFLGTYYQSSADTRIDDDELDDIPLTDVFFDDIKKIAIRDADRIVADIIEHGLPYRHGNHPTRDNLTEYYLLKKLSEMAGAAGAQDPFREFSYPNMESVHAPDVGIAAE